MSINQLLLPSNDAHIESWKNLGLNSLHVKSLTVNSHPMTFNVLDATIPVNTYDGANNLVTADVFSLNVHAVLVGHIVVLTIAAFGYTAPGAFNYFGFQLPAGFIPNTINVGLLQATLNTTVEVTKYSITSGGQVRISGDLASNNFVLNDIFGSLQQTITYDNSN